MRVDVLGLDGSKVKNIELPEQFNEDYEPVLIRRAILVINSHKRQQYGVAYQAGMNYSAKLSRRRRDYKGAYGKGISRVPRKTMTRRGMQFTWVGAVAPGTVGGRQAHPPKAEKVWDLKINIKERKKAIRSALSGIYLNKKLIVIDNKIEEEKKARELKKVFDKLGLDLEVVKRKRAGRGKSRGRAISYKKKALIVVGGNCDLLKAVSNLPGYNAVAVKSLNVALLTVGHNEARQCLFTEGAIEKIVKEKLFLGSER